MCKLQSLPNVWKKGDKAYSDIPKPQRSQMKNGRLVWNFIYGHI